MTPPSKRLKTSQTQEEEVVAAAAFKELVQICRGPNLSFFLLRDKLSCIRSHQASYQKWLLHHVCEGDGVTLEIVRYLDELQPDAVRTKAPSSRSGRLPLHRACLNVKCPSNVIKFLISKYDEALRIPCRESGLPLHCLLCRILHGREIDSSDLSLVSHLVTTSPGALTNQDFDPGFQGGNGGTPLFLACCYNKNSSLLVELLQLLVDDQRLVLSLVIGPSSSLPIHCILRLDRRPPHDVVKFLLDNGEVALLDARDGENNTPLHIACSNDYVPLEIIKLIVEKNDEIVRSTGCRGDLPLHSFCKRNDLDLDILKYLIEQYPEGVQIKNDYYSGRKLPASYAFGKSLEATKTLVAAFPESARIALLHACRHGCFETLECLCGLYPEAVTQSSSPYSDLLLHGAVECNNGHRAAVIAFLIERYPDGIKAEGERQDLPFLRLCKHSPDLRSIQTLFNAFPTAIRKADFDERGPFHFVYGKSEPLKEVVEFLSSEMRCGLKMEDKEGLIPAHYACKNGSLAVVEDVLGRWPGGVRVNSPTHGLPIHYACTHYADLEVIKYLVSLYPGSLKICNDSVGLPLECVNRRTRGRDVFMYLLRQRYKPVVFLLLEILLDDKIKDKKATAFRLISFFPGHALEANGQGLFSLHLAVEKVPDIDFVNRLIELNPKAVEMQDSQGRLPLHYALRCQPQLILVKCLLDEYPKGIEVVDHQLRTPLHIACQYGASVEVVRCLLEVERKVATMRDWHGCTPLHVAAWRGASLEVIASLADADPNALSMTDSNIDKPLHKACRGGHGAAASYLAQRHMPAVWETDSTRLLPALLLAQSPGSIQESNRESTAESFFPCLDAIWFLLRSRPDIARLDCDE